MSFHMPSSLPLSHEASINFNDQDEETDSQRSPTPHLDWALVGPEWHHQKSFYQTHSPSYPTIPSYRPPVISRPMQSYSPQPAAKQVSPPNLIRRSGSGVPEVSLADTIDVFVDNKFLNTHNLHYGPAVIRIEDNHPVYSGNSSFSGSSWSHNSPESSWDKETQSNSPYSKGNSYRGSSSTSSSGSSIITI